MDVDNLEQRLPHTDIRLICMGQMTFAGYHLLGLGNARLMVALGDPDERSATVNHCVGRYMHSSAPYTDVCTVFQRPHHGLILCTSSAGLSAEDTVPKGGQALDR